MFAIVESVRETCLGPVESLPVGEGRTFVVEGERVAVFRGRDGSVYAVQAECPHQRGPLAEGVTGGCTVVCPLHAWKFDLASGACLTDPAHRLRTYPVRMAHGQVYVGGGGRAE